MKNLNNNLHQITSANNINSKKLHKNNYENIVYKNYNKSQIDTDVIIVLKFGTVGILKFKTRSKTMTLLIKE